MIIAGYAGVGKTTVANKYPDKVIDLDPLHYRWIFTEKATGLSDDERKGNNDIRIENPEYPSNYIKAIINEYSKYEIVLISNQSLSKAEMDYIEKQINDKIVHIVPENNEETKNIYMSHYIERGNIPKYVDKKKKNGKSQLDIYHLIGILSSCLIMQP